MKSIPAYMTVLLMAGVLGRDGIPAKAAAPPPLTGAALLDDWGNRMSALGGMVGENSLRTQIRTTIAQLAMFDAVNAVLDGRYPPFASRPGSAPQHHPKRRRSRSVRRRGPRVPEEIATIEGAYDAVDCRRARRQSKPSPSAIAAGEDAAECGAGGARGR